MILDIKDKFIKIFLLTGFVVCPAALATQLDSNSYFSWSNLKSAKIAIQLGGISADQGHEQDINIQGLIGDRFTVTHHDDQNVLVGLGFYMDGLNKNSYSLMYGINAFFLGPTKVKGNIIQEKLFTNLAYRYSVTNYPIYVDAKALIPVDCDQQYKVTLDLGIGPNIIQTSKVHETSLDGVTIPDNAFSGNTKAAFSATVGVGIQFANVYRNTPVECGYRFFYLGQGDFSKRTNQLLSTLKTSNSYANALLCSVTI